MLPQTRERMTTGTVRGLLGSAALALACACVFTALTLYGVISVEGARILLFVAWAICVIGTLISESIWGKVWPRGTFVVIGIAVVLGSAFVRLDRWALRKRVTLQENQQTDLVLPIGPAATVPSADLPKSASKPRAPGKTRQEALAAALEGDLSGAGPAINDGKAHGFPMVQIGGTTLIMTPNGVPEMFELFPDANIRVEWGYKGPLFTTTVRDRNGNLTAEVTRNHWRVYPLFSADKNYTQTALEVKDNAGHVVLQVRILPEVIQLQGEWWDTQGNGIRFLRPTVVTPDKGALVEHLGPRDQHTEALIEPIFQYPSKDHLGEFIQ